MVARRQCDVRAGRQRRSVGNSLLHGVPPAVGQAARDASGAPLGRFPGCRPEQEHRAPLARLHFPPTGSPNLKLSPPFVPPAGRFNDTPRRQQCDVPAERHRDNTAPGLRMFPTYAGETGRGTGVHPPPGRFAQMPTGPWSVSKAGADEGRGGLAGVVVRPGHPAALGGASGGKQGAARRARLMGSLRQSVPHAEGEAGRGREPAPS